MSYRHNLEFNVQAATHLSIVWYHLKHLKTQDVKRGIETIQDWSMSVIT